MTRLLGAFAWPSRLVARLRRPQHCETCGDEFVVATYVDGHRRSDGTQIVRSWKRCPRSDDDRPRYSRYHQVGACHPPYPMSCVVQKQAYYRDHRPWWTACEHASVDHDGSACWARDGRQITRDGRRVDATTVAALVNVGFDPASAVDSVMRRS